MLQTLVTSSAFPDSVLRVSGRKIANILQPTSGLQDVLKSSAFDVSAVKQKLDGAGVIPSSGQCLSCIVGVADLQRSHTQRFCVKASSIYNR